MSRTTLKTSDTAHSEAGIDSRCDVGRTDASPGGHSDDNRKSRRARMRCCVTRRDKQSELVAPAGSRDLPSLPPATAARSQFGFLNKLEN